MAKSIEEKNRELLRSMGVPVKMMPQSFTRVRSVGDKNTAYTVDGDKIERQEYIFHEGYGMVRCVPYELHFVYEEKSGKKGRWGYMCTCGSIAGIISYKEVKTLMSMEAHGYILACIAHTASRQNTGVGRHADGSTE